MSITIQSILTEFNHSLENPSIYEVDDLEEFIEYVETRWKRIFYKSLIPFEILRCKKLKDISELAMFCVINSHYTKCLPGLQASLMDVLNKYKTYLKKEDLDNLETITSYFLFCKTKLKEGENIYKKKIMFSDPTDPRYETIMEELLSLDLNDKKTFLNSYFHLT